MLSSCVVTIEGKMYSKQKNKMKKLDIDIILSYNKSEGIKN